MQRTNTEKCLTLSGSSVYRGEDSSDDERLRDRSPLRTDDRRDTSNYGPADSRKQKLTFAVKPIVTPKPTVASVFNADDDEEPEEMPAEARMRMRNIGRETPTSAGPNSFGKTKQGFCDSKKIFEKTLKKAMEGSNK
ncbi:hypothetical protein PV327_005785 [Microctonus hyperodae]|uniref:PEST proteolytic signal-containing nuclear protein n=1 Tax=Microctonus hyperodae TaxID=165561 RepID=A0AA39G2J5_MICHY|nr:hypothetical protein PV327_005785 [Microctonus hyperodae]